MIERATLDMAAQIGRDAAKRAGKAGRDSQNPGISRREATVTAVNGDGTVDVNYGSEASPKILNGIRMTSACYGVRVGDRVILDTLGHISYVTGILVHDNHHYVKLITSTEHISSGEIKVAVSQGIATLYAYFRTSVQLAGWSDTRIATGLPAPSDAGTWCSSQICWQTTNKYNTVLRVDGDGSLWLMHKQDGAMASGQWGFAGLAYPVG